MKIKQFRKAFVSALGPVYDAIEAENFFHMLLEEYQGLKRVDLTINPELELPPSTVAAFESAMEKLLREIPIQYIIGKAHFYGLEFFVSSDVLIPRPETEELVDWIIRDFGFKGSPKIIDIGTGSGCIAVSVAKNLPDAKISALDISAGALEMAKKNANHNAVPINFIKADILNSSDTDGQFDVIVSNPPYVRNLEKAEIRKNVLENEPHLALFVDDDDALLFYRKIADFAILNLAEAGCLYFEINQYLARETVDMLCAKGFRNVELRKDLSGNDRMIKCTLAHS